MGVLCGHCPGATCSISRGLAAGLSLAHSIKPACCLADISLCVLCSNNPPQGQIRFIWEGKSARGFRMTMLIRNQNINSNSTWMH